MIAKSGFTLIELVIVIMILGALIAIAIPKFTDITTKTAIAASKANQNSVVSAFAVYLGENNGTYPTVAQLAVQLQSAGASMAAEASGIRFTIAGDNYTIATYKDGSCMTPSAATTDVIKCVGDVS